MPKTPRRHEPESASPDRGVEISDPRPSTYEPSHVIQLLVEVQKELAANTTKVDRAITDLHNLTARVDGLRISFAWAKGFAAAAVILIPIAAFVVWWLIGDQINQLKAQLLGSTPPAVASPQPPAPVPGAPKLK
jgi:hypothetical protein